MSRPEIREPKASQQSALLCALLNLVAPGAGIALLGWPVLGLAIGIAFSAVCTATVLARFVMPADYALWQLVTLVLITAAIYLLAQAAGLRLAGRSPVQSDAARRTNCMRRCDELADRGEFGEAIASLMSDRDLVERDVALAARMADLHVRAGSVAEAEWWWERVGLLDRDRIYADQRRAFRKPNE